MTEQENPTDEIVVVNESVQLGSLQVAPEAIVERATRVAEALADVIKQKKLSVKIRNKEYVRVEGWSTLGAMIGVLPRTVSVIEIQDGIFEATVELIRTTDQAIIGRGIAECGSIDEIDRNGNPIWANRPRYARKSMAITRATGKAFRLGLAWIMELAGYSGTPAEEMGEVVNGEILKEETATDESKMKARQKPSYWPSSVLSAIVEKGYAENDFEAAGMLSYSTYQGNCALQPALVYSQHYRAARDEGDKPKEAGVKGMAAYLETLRPKEDRYEVQE